MLALDFHPVNCALLAIGIGNGTVEVIDIKSEHNEPLYVSSVNGIRHTDIVTNIRWTNDT